MEIRRLGPDDVDELLAAARLFDGPCRRAWTAQFLDRDGHHLMLAYVDGVAVGFASGIEMTHPDKGTELFLYELSVAEDHRRQGIGRALTLALAQIATERGCYAMWTACEEDNTAAIRTYRSAGAPAPERCLTLTWALEKG